MKQGPQIATAVAIGYALGRSRRMKLALMVGGVVLGRRMGDPKELLAKAGGAVAPSGELGGALRDRLAEAARTAAVAAASNEIKSLSDNLSERAAQIRSPQSDSSEAEDDGEVSSEGPETPEQRTSSEDEPRSESSEKRTSSEDEPESESSEKRSSTADDQQAEPGTRARAPRKPSAPRKKAAAGSSSGSNRRSGGNDG
ncbi:hypothetical protein [Saccharopolyspora mangrovi]|uniref:DNA primase n=1 Tax=Saccharopolyspora mangrovi TaxID=3082379 RepID=A0ABU6AKA1_9PSEU|nr:hypothetical protein [Saccharopolyspora sp. S2-29]MEB3371981.1 hypothetical protein [Saccharopolyspora sp. S2-29]